jgi:hypothetical protein
MVDKVEEFPPDRSRAFRRQQATVRILTIAGSKLVEPPTLHLLGFTAWATMGVASLEAMILCHEWPWWESWEAGRFVWWYSIHQLVPSIVWDSQDATLIAKSLGLDPSTLLRDFSAVMTTSTSTTIPTTTTALTIDDSVLATALLRLHFLETVRFFVAGFMMIASIVRAAGVSAGAFAVYEERIRLGREPPLSMMDKDQTSGVVIRLCGRDSFTTEVSMNKMGVHLLPIFESPDRVQHLVWKHSEQLHRPVYWCVKEHKYGSTYSWDQFPVDSWMLADPWNKDSLLSSSSSSSSSPGSDVTATNRRKILFLEADATNPHDPLALGNAALDLNLDDASQGFRRLQERFSRAYPHPPGEPKPFRTLRVYLGNSLEVSRTGGGHSYTLRHRVRYAKEMDVLIDSRAPVLERILEWCQRVAGSDRRIMFQTSSPEYFRSLQTILRCYGYEIFDPLDPRSLWLCQTKHYRSHGGPLEGRPQTATSESGSDGSSSSNNAELFDVVSPSVAGLIMDDPVLLDIAQRHGMAGVLSMLGGGSYELQDSPPSVDEDPGSRPARQQQQPHDEDSEMLRHVAKMAHMPRLVHMPTTAETVNAVEALITAGEVDATNCCAILERHGGVAALEYILQQKSDLVRGERHQEWIHDESSSSSTFSSSPYDGGDDGNDIPAATGLQDSRCRTGISNNNHGRTTHETNPTNNVPLNRWAEARKRRAGGGAGLQMICTSSIYDDLFRQVRIWARMGFTSAQIQKEIDIRFHKILDYSHEAQREHTRGDGTPENETSPPPKSAIPV